MDDNRIRIKEARKRAKDLGLKLRVGKVANKTMLNAPSVESAYQRFNYLQTGETKTIDRRTVHLLCNELHVDPNFLFGWDGPPMESEE